MAVEGVLWRWWERGCVGGDGGHRKGKDPSSFVADWLQGRPRILATIVD